LITVFLEIRKDTSMVDSRQAVVAAIGAAMQRYQRSVQAFDDAVGRALELGPADLRCLDWLADGPKSAGAVARGAGLRRGLVERVPDETDRRRVLVRMTAHAEREVAALYGPMVAEGVGLFDDLAAEDLERLGVLLQRMTALTDRHRARLER
jgi:hypothetical protein